DRRVFQGLQRRLNAAEGALGRRRCEPVARHRNTGKTRSSTCGEASTGVAPRLEQEVLDSCHYSFSSCHYSFSTRSKHGRRTAIGTGSIGIICEAYARRKQGKRTRVDMVILDDCSDRFNDMARDYLKQAKPSRIW
ncbi:MAG: hypothetical protein WBZ29_00045, partial [Methanocella sp.]